MIYDIMIVVKEALLGGGSTTKLIVCKWKQILYKVRPPPPHNTMPHATAIERDREGGVAGNYMSDYSGSQSFHF